MSASSGARQSETARALASPLPLPRTLWALGFSAWKKPIVRRFIPECDLRFVDQAQQLPAGATVVVWASRRHSLLPTASVQGRSLRVVTLEDGFLRSVGLGAALVQPLSLVLDTRGCHFDPNQPSDLELTLEHGHFEADECRQARELRQAIVSLGLTKYNVGRNSWLPSPAWTKARQDGGVVLVIGQVEGDASLREGSPVVRSNLALLQAVRERSPGVHIVYKPHPDVTAGLRQAGITEHRVAECCDELLADVALPALLPHVDVVHVMTSLAGLEALLRGIPVVTHGQPFYAGWGLTTDLCAPQRRHRRLHLDELIAGALLRYPRYALPECGCLVDAFQAVGALKKQARGGTESLPARIRLAFVRHALKLRVQNVNASRNSERFGVNSDFGVSRKQLP